MNSFTIGSIIQEGIKLGVKYLLPYVINLFLWCITIWIPYLNVGTTIGMFYGILIKISKGEKLEPTEIFKPEYRKYMGDFFLTGALVGIGVILGTYFLIIPGIVTSIAWSLAIPLLLDKKLNGMEAIKKSNDLTYGKKATIFFGVLLLAIGACIAIFIISYIFGLISSVLSALICFAAFLGFMAIMAGAKAFIYKSLVK